MFMDPKERAKLVKRKKKGLTEKDLDYEEVFDDDNEEDVFGDSEEVAEDDEDQLSEDGKKIKIAWKGEEDLPQQP